MTSAAAYSIAESLSALVSPRDGYAFGSAVKKKIEAFEAACVVRFGDDAPAVACVGADGDVTFLMHDDPVLSETTYVRLSVRSSCLGRGLSRHRARSSRTAS